MTDPNEQMDQDAAEELTGSADVLGDALPAAPSSAGGGTSEQQQPE